MGSKKELRKDIIVELEYTGERVVPGKTPYVVYQEHINRYFFASKYIKDKLVLDVASGTGYGSYYLAKNGAKKVIGLDASKDAVIYAKNFYETRHLSFILGEATSLPFYDESFDVVVSFETIEHIKEYRKFLSECKRVLKDNGLFICSTPNKKISSPHTEKPLNPFHFKEFYPEEFFDLLNEYFVNVKLYGQCDINLTKKLIKIGVNILSIIPTGNTVKKIIKKFINLNKEYRDFYNTEKKEKKLEEIIDENYKVSKFKNNLFTTSKYIIAIAEKGEV